MSTEQPPGADTGTPSPVADRRIVEKWGGGEFTLTVSRNKPRWLGVVLCALGGAPFLYYLVQVHAAKGWNDQSWFLLAIVASNATVAIVGVAATGRSTAILTISKSTVAIRYIPQRPWEKAFSVARKDVVRFWTRTDRSVGGPGGGAAAWRELLVETASGSRELGLAPGGRASGFAVLDDLADRLNYVLLCIGDTPEGAYRS